MPRDFREYSAREWRRLRPFLERYKQARYKALHHYLLRRPSARVVLPGPEVLARLKGGRVICTVAFNQPENVAMQARLVARNVPGAIHLVADNSSDPDAARQIWAIAEKAGAVYARPPETPWKGDAGGRSHGFAMTWLWRNLIRPAAPEAFGFIDHDLYPMQPTDPFAPLATYPACGFIWDRRGIRWHLWAGFCFFRYADVAALPLDFALDWYAGVDTGGANWWTLYRRLDPSRIVDPGRRLEPILEGVSAERCGVEWLGPWLHEGNFRFAPEFHDRKHAAVMRLLEKAAAEGITDR